MLLTTITLGQKIPHQNLDVSLHVLQQKIATITTGLQTCITEMGAPCFQCVTQSVLVPTMVCILVGILTIIVHVLLLKLRRNHCRYKNKTVMKAKNLSSLVLDGQWGASSSLECYDPYPQFYYRKYMWSKRNLKLWAFKWAIVCFSTFNGSFRIWARVPETQWLPQLICTPF